MQKKVSKKLRQPGGHFGQTVVPSTACDLGFCLFVCLFYTVIMSVSYAMKKQDVEGKKTLRKKVINKNLESALQVKLLLHR